MVQQRFRATEIAELLVSGSKNVEKPCFDQRLRRNSAGNSFRAAIQDVAHAGGPAVRSFRAEILKQADHEFEMRSAVAASRRSLRVSTARPMQSAVMVTVKMRRGGRGDASAAKRTCWPDTTTNRRARAPEILVDSAADPRRVRRRTHNAVRDPCAMPSERYCRDRASMLFTARVWPRQPHWRQPRWAVPGIVSQISRSRAVGVRSLPETGVFREISS